MSGLKTKTVMAGEGEGSETYCFEAPEEIHFWTLENKWKDDIFRKYKVQIEGLKISSQDTVGFSHIDKFNQTDKKLPLKSSAIVTEGEYRSVQSIKAKFDLRVESAYEVNTALQEISKRVKIDSWSLRAIDIYNAQEAVHLKFLRFNPNGSSTSLYLKYIIKDGNEKSWQDVPLATQKKYVGDFYNGIAHCTMVSTLVASCAVKHKIPKKQIKKRKK